MDYTNFNDRVEGYKSYYNTTSERDGMQPGSESGSTSMYYIWISILSLFVVIYFLLACQDKRSGQRVGMGNTQQKDKEELTPQERRRFYEERFEKTGNQLKLTKEHMKLIQNLDEEQQDRQKDVEVAFEKAFKCKRERQNSFISSLFGKRFQDKGSMVPNLIVTMAGQCAICLDNYKEADTVVWSEDNDCHHIYHKECIIDYLSCKKDSNMSNNPCPTCRRNFCLLQGSSNQTEPAEAPVSQEASHSAEESV